MGMYTQVRGWLNVDSISKEENIKKIKDNLELAKYEFRLDKSLIDDDSGEQLNRKWVCDDTVIHTGGNGSIYIFFGTELKNYGNPAYQWIKYLLQYFPNAEGRIDFQYEEENYYNGDESRYLLIRDGKIIEDDWCKTWCNGYGNIYENPELI